MEPSRHHYLPGTPAGNTRLSEKPPDPAVQVSYHARAGDPARVAIQANTPKHLRVLTGAGLLSRRKDGLQVFHRLADPVAVEQVFRLVSGTIRRGSTR
jgi:hypothetical protein